MYAAAMKSTKKNKSMGVAHHVGQKEDRIRQGFDFVDKRPQAVSQRKLQKIANNPNQAKQTKPVQTLTAQLKKVDASKLNVIGELHEESDSRRDEERVIASNEANGGYWEEGEFKIIDSEERGDSPGLLLEQNAVILADNCELYSYEISTYNEWDNDTRDEMVDIFKGFSRFEEDIHIHNDRLPDDQKRNDLVNSCDEIFVIINAIIAGKKDIPLINNFDTAVANIKAELGGRDHDEIRRLRSFRMHFSANTSSQKKGIWKIGDNHIDDIQHTLKLAPEEREYAMQSRGDFNRTYFPEK